MKRRRGALHESAAERQLPLSGTIADGLKFPLAGPEPIRVFVYPKLRFRVYFQASLCTNTSTHILLGFPHLFTLPSLENLSFTHFFTSVPSKFGVGREHSSLEAFSYHLASPPKERGPAQSRTSADAHEAEPFQMRDMYMSLIGAQLQSIHRGQVATAEMIVGMYDNPPAHRWTMDEFHNVVAWPEEPLHGGAGAAEASARDMEEDEAEEEDAFDEDDDEEEEEDTEDSSD
ncbi:hypothetical protein LR48_Vigan317s000100 [Vigna angularis]|uniref:Uncharacterized protein n=1 Tax=Phaseolus angularis TaxID=3914 RepID=A0A0L9T847_PHAAN|nr:hypothetical protein LR48_Vigan317s000100 [Vigna angularis]